MKNIVFTFSLLLAILLCQFTMFAQTDGLQKVFANKSKSSVTYAMSHPLHDWEGTSNEVSAVALIDESTKSINSVAVSIKVASFDSKNANRDSHMIEVLEGIKYPSVTFASNSIQVSGDSIFVKGDLTFHGVTKPFEIHAKKTESNNQEIFEGNFGVSMEAFSIENPSLMGMSTNDNIKISFHALFDLP